jgi:hypothetical protein
VVAGHERALRSGLLDALAQELGGERVPQIVEAHRDAQRVRPQLGIERH